LVVSTYAGFLCRIDRDTGETDPFQSGWGTRACASLLQPPTPAMPELASAQLIEQHEREVTGESAASRRVSPGPLSYGNEGGVAGAGATAGSEAPDERAGCSRWTLLDFFQAHRALAGACFAPLARFHN
jgi:hypothetical protein